jgi:limonene-1,2-epoxide hydrolase/predicted enzyme related to lactoylglutathione lyase
MSDRESTFEALRTAVRDDDLEVLERLLADDARWYGNYPGGACRSREHVIAMLRSLAEDGVTLQARAVREAGDAALLEVGLASPRGDRTAWVVLTLDGEGRIAQVQDYLSEAAAEHDLALRAGAGPGAGPPPPVAGLVPFTQVADIERSVAFYALLGLQVEDTFEPDGRLAWAYLARGDARLMLAHSGEPVDARAQRVLFYVYARDLDALRDHLVAHGATPGEIVDGSPGPKREMHVVDPDGYSVMVAEIDDETIVS